MATALVVDDLCVLFVGVEVVGPGGVLQLGNGIGRPHVLFATGAPGVLATGIEHIGQHGVVAKCSLVHANGFLGHLKHANAFHLGGRAGEVLLDGGGIDTNGFEQLGTAVAHVGAHAHFGHNLGQALAHRLDVVVDRLVSAQLAGQVLVQADEGLQREVGVDGFCAVARQHREVVHLASSAGFNHQACRRAQAGPHQMLVNGRQRQQRRNGDLGGRHPTVADDQDVLATVDGVHRFGTQRGQLGFHTLTAPAHGVGDVQRGQLELALGGLLDAAQLGHVFEVEHRLAHFEAHGRVDLVDVQ